MVRPIPVRRAAHPRSRGENSLLASLRMKNSGSSPLTRGKPVFMTETPSLGGLIPAHAGKTSSGSRRVSGGRAHPRSRGENHRAASGRAVRGGSSPLTRGKPVGHMVFTPFRRLIPAHAGKTFTVNDDDIISGAHPRSRGENLLFDNVGKDIPGSSPLTRGKL